MTAAVRSLWLEPAVPRPPMRGWRDSTLVGVLVAAMIVEGIVRTNMVWRPAAVVLGVALACTLLWRRTHPLAVVIVFFGVQAAAATATLLTGDESAIPYTIGVVGVFLTYSLVRWGSGRDAVIGLPVILIAEFLREVGESDALSAAAWSVFWLFIATLGASMRYRAESRLRDLERVKALEREQLARELHDTVAHHVSAIAIHAQAGRTVGRTHPDAAVNALDVIEQEASRTLAEMRAMVGVLRAGHGSDLVPQRGVADIERLTRGMASRPGVEVELSGDLDDLGPSIDRALYRLAQESITNAVRHARHATRIEVRVAGNGEWVRLTVRDDGDPRPNERIASGYGLAGMAERATLLGGTLEAGPNSGRGWVVDVVLPKVGAPS